MSTPYHKFLFNDTEFKALHASVLQSPIVESMRDVAQKEVGILAQVI
jgi:hypothetical protein